MDRVLKYGCYITISKDDGYVYSEGFIDTSLRIEIWNNENQLDFHCCIFRVLPACNHSVQSQVMKIINEKQEIRKHELAKYEEALASEMKTNSDNYRKLKNQPIKYNSIIQLEHVQSNKYLTVEPKETSELQKDNLKLLLKEFASLNSQFRIIPTYKFQQDGDNFVRYSDTVCLGTKVTDFVQNAYVYTSFDQKQEQKLHSLWQKFVKQDVFNENVREVNVSLDKKAQWVLNQYADYISNSSLYIKCGDSI